MCKYHKTPVEQLHSTYYKKPNRSDSWLLFVSGNRRLPMPPRRLSVCEFSLVNIVLLYYYMNTDESIHGAAAGGVESG